MTPALFPVSVPGKSAIEIRAGVVMDLHTSYLLPARIDSFWKNSELPRHFCQLDSARIWGFDLSRADRVERGHGG